MPRIISDETSASLTKKIYGIEVRSGAKSEVETEKATRIMNLLQRQKQHRIIDANDALIKSIHTCVKEV